MRYLFFLIIFPVILGCAEEKEIKQKQKVLWICGSHLCQEGLGPVVRCDDSVHGSVIHNLCNAVGYRYHTRNKVGTIGEDILGNKYMITSNGCISIDATERATK